MESPQLPVIDIINSWLEQEYGKDLTGRPNWRVVFTSAQLEKRAGLINEFYGEIFVRQRFGVHELPKYNWMRERWLLEELVFSKPDPTLVDTQGGHYEPRYKYQLPEQYGGGYVVPSLKAVQYTMKTITAARLWGRAGKQHVQDTWTAEEDAEEMARIHACLGEIWDPEPSDLEAKFAFKEAVVSAARPSEL